jgi:hypothetical protein
MGYFHRFLIFGLLAELLPIQISKNISGHFLLFFDFIPPQPPSGEQTHHVIKVIKDPSKDTLLTLNCSITVTLVIKIYLEINYLIIINNATIQSQQSSF